MAIGDVIRFIRRVEIDGQLHVNVLHFGDQVESRPDGVEELLDQWDNPFATLCPEEAFRELQRGYTSLTQIDISAQVIYPTEGEIISRGIESPAAASTDSGLPSFAQTKFSIATFLNSRSGRGGFYVGGIPESATNGNLVTAAYQLEQTNVIGRIAAYFSIGGAEYDGYILGVWSELLQDWNAMSSMSAAADIGTMRSRRTGRGV